MTEQRYKAVLAVNADGRTVGEAASERRSGVRKAAATRLRLPDLPVGYWQYLVASALFGLGQRHQRAGNPARSESGSHSETLMAAFGVFVIAYLGFALGPSVVAVGVLLVFFASSRAPSEPGARR